MRGACTPLHRTWYLGFGEIVLALPAPPLRVLLCVCNAQHKNTLQTLQPLQTLLFLQTLLRQLITVLLFFLGVGDSDLFQVQFVK